MPSEKEILENILRLTEAQVYLNSANLCSLLYRAYPNSVDFVFGFVTAQLSAGEEMLIEYRPPVGKVTVSSFKKFVFETQRVTSVKWHRDGKLLLDGSGMVDVQLETPFTYASWYPIRSLSTYRITNNDSSSKYFSIFYTAYNIDEKLFMSVVKTLDRLGKYLIPGF